MDQFSAQKTIKSMAAMASTEIQIVNIPNLAKIETFLNDSAYRELLESSENYNTRLCIERRLRMPFLDQQTGVAQTHCALFMKRRQRMPGLREGQIYTYPSAKWRKSKRQYLLHHHRPFRMVREPDPDSIPGLDRSSFGTGDSESKDSHPEPKEWFYDDEVNMHEVVEGFEERGDSDFDYEDNYNKKKRRGGTSGPRKSVPSVDRRGRGRGRGRRSNKNLDGGDSPRTPIRRRPIPGGASGASGATGTSGGISGNLGGASSSGVNTLTGFNTLSPSMPSGSSSPLTIINEDSQQMQPLIMSELQPPPIAQPSHTAAPPVEEDEQRLRIIRKPNERGKAAPSPYCDFCLGDSRENKKTNIPEDLVSCSDCGRSGHPSCLQFTPNMIISVKKYRWQCIECKYCSICGTSDNDDQLLFCDDCDRGYHMYCLSPPLTSPPEGSWSCNICTEEFHSGK